MREEYTLDWSQSKVFLVYSIYMPKILRIGWQAVIAILVIQRLPYGPQCRARYVKEFRF